MPPVHITAHFTGVDMEVAVDVPNAEALDTRQNRAANVMNSVMLTLSTRKWANRFLNGATNLYFQLDQRPDKRPLVVYNLMVTVVIYPWWRAWRKLVFFKVYTHEFMNAQEQAATSRLIVNEIDAVMDSPRWWMFWRK